MKLTRDIREPTQLVASSTPIYPMEDKDLMSAARSRIAPPMCEVAYRLVNWMLLSGGVRLEISIANALKASSSVGILKPSYSQEGPWWLTSSSSAGAKVVGASPLTSREASCPPPPEAFLETTRDRGEPTSMGTDGLLGDVLLL